MRNLIIATGILFLTATVSGQNSIGNVLSEIEKNNTTLLSFQKSIEANKVANKTDIYLDNPEVGFNYLWGDPSAMGTRTDLSITQSFDFPTVYGHKKKIANSMNAQADLEYEKQKRDLLFEARLLCSDLIYSNARKAELSKRIIHAQSIASSHKAKYEKGEINVLEFNKAHLNLLNLSKELETVAMERNLLRAELISLNGGKAILLSDSAYSAVVIPADFEAWYTEAEQGNPLLSWLAQEIEISKKRVKLDKAQSLPKFQTGYMSEKIVGEQFQGVAFGLSIPLWENKNKVKLAQANTLMLESTEVDAKLKYHNNLKALHSKAVLLQENINDYRAQVIVYDNSELAKKALDSGEISLIDYMMELSISYESFNNILDMEKELSRTIAEINRY